MGKNKVNITHRELTEIGKNTPPPVLITGMHNSGTSILTEIVHKCGVFMGKSMDHFESHFFSMFINDQIIMGGGSNWAKTPIMSQDEVKSYINTAGEFAKNNWIVEYVQNGYDGVSKWGFKDPRICVLMPLYVEVFPDAKLIFIDRNTEDIALSLSRKRKKGVGNINNLQHWINLTKQYKKRAKDFSREFRDFHYVKYEKFCNHTEDVLDNLSKFLDVNITKSAQDATKKVHNERVKLKKEPTIASKKRIRRIVNKIKNRLI